jgi:peroxiredoxin
LPYPLLSDFPELRTIRQYGVLSAAGTGAAGPVQGPHHHGNAQRSFFLVDQQGILRHQWLLGEAGDATVFPSEPILKVVREIAGKR